MTNVASLPSFSSVNDLLHRASWNRRKRSEQRMFQQPSELVLLLARHEYGMKIAGRRGPMTRGAFTSRCRFARQTVTLFLELHQQLDGGLWLAFDFDSRRGNEEC